MLVSWLHSSAVHLDVQCIIVIAFDQLGSYYVRFDFTIFSITTCDEPLLLFSGEKLVIDTGRRLCY